MADTQFHALPTKAAPNDWVLPASLEMTLKAARALFDGTGAGGAFLPALEIISDSGTPVGTYVAGTAVSAGSSADVSFAPFLKGATASGGSQVFPSWTFWSPVWTDPTGTNPTVAFTANYMRLKGANNDSSNDTVFGNMRAVISAAGTGNMYISTLPVPCTRPPSAIGHGFIEDVSAKTIYPLTFYLTGLNSAVMIVGGVDTGSTPKVVGGWGPTYPFTVASPDFAEMFFMYEVEGGL